MCLPSDFDKYHFSSNRKNMIAIELGDWHKHYLPIKSGGTVLDVGAGEGETMIFYLLHGAKRIICIEADKKKSRYLAYNAKIAEKEFDAHIIAVSAWLDNIKIDIDGGEEGMVLEKHFAGYWREIGRSKGLPAATKIYKLTKRTRVDRILHSKELLMTRILHPEAYNSERSKNSRT